MYKIVNGNKEHLIEAYDDENKLVGTAVFSVFDPADIYNNPRLSIYIDIQSEIEEVKDQLFEAMMARGRNVKSENSEIDVKIYHCCLSDNAENIAYYRSKKGFDQEDAMCILKNDTINGQYEFLREIEGFEIKEICLEDLNVREELIEKQNIVFKSGYDHESLLELAKDDTCFSIAAFHAKEIAGNIIVVLKTDESGKQHAWIDDLFVSKEWRNKGIARTLVGKTLEKLGEMQIFDSRLEHWSENTRALALYSDMGFKKYDETEIAIGMFL